MSTDVNVWPGEVELAYIDHGTDGHTTLVLDGEGEVIERSLIHGEPSERNLGCYVQPDDIESLVNGAHDRRLLLETIESAQAGEKVEPFLPSL
jgi:hypothetical protein